MWLNLGIYLLIVASGLSVMFLSVKYHRLPAQRKGFIPDRND